MGSEICSIIAGPVDEGRFAPAHERQAQDVHPRCCYNASVVPDAPFAIEHGYVEPGIVGPISCRPNHRPDPAAVQIEAKPRFWPGIGGLVAMRFRKPPGKAVRLHPSIDAGKEAV